MEWKKIRAEKLDRSHAADDAAALRPPKGTFSRRLRRNWDRFWSGSDWGRFAVLAAVIILPAIVWFAYVALSSDDSSGGAALEAPAAPTERDLSAIAQPTATDVPTRTPAPTSTPEPEATPEPRATPEPSATNPPNRKDCDEIEGTAYLSVAEREWFLANCDATVVEAPPPTSPPSASQPDQPSSPPSSGPSNPPPTSPPPPPPPPPPPTSPAPAPTATPSGGPVLTSDQAAGAAINWIENIARIASSAGPCAATWNGNHWVVSCQTSSGSMTVCIIEDPRAYWQC